MNIIICKSATIKKIWVVCIYYLNNFCFDKNKKIHSMIGIDVDLCDGTSLEQG